jgi:hypothetical protein
MAVTSPIGHYALLLRMGSGPSSTDVPCGRVDARGFEIIRDAASTFFGWRKAH